MKSGVLLFYAEAVRCGCGRGVEADCGGLWWSGLAASEEVVFVGVRLLAVYKE